MDDLIDSNSMLINENVIIRNKIFSDSTLANINSTSIINDSDSDDQHLNDVISTIDLNCNEVIETAILAEIDVEEQTSTEPQQQHKTAGIINPVIRPCQFSISRIKNIMKLDPELALTSKESVFLVAKATVSFQSRLKF
jgi:hypothetical protein